MARLASPIDDLKSHYTVVVVGSGYGGAIAASRLARAGQQVCLLERGKEFQPGEYPDTPIEAAESMQADLPGRHLGSRTGLYDLRINDDINVFLGCGLGGTSLVNANVSLRPEPRIFDDPLWPQALRDDLNTLLDDGYRRAEEMLKPTPYPIDFPRLPKLAALEKSGAALNQTFYRPPINVTFKEGINHVGVEQHACTLCGDCVSGCNYAAKNTVLMNYLPDAKNHGAEIFTQVAVRRLERQGSRWLVYHQMLDSGREAFDAPEVFLTADVVILAAGTLGSTEILLRSKAAGLTLSDRVGRRFTGNGDVLAFGYNADSRIDGIGFGSRPPGDLDPVGPCITGIVDVRNQPRLDDGMVIEEGSVPGGLASFLPTALAAASEVAGKNTADGVVNRIEQRAREAESLLLGPYHGAVRNTQTYLVMTHDGSEGRMYLEDDRLRIAWPGVGAQPIFQQVSERLEQATRPLGGVFVPNPVWSRLSSHNLITVHPLGGCGMAEDASNGVVNHKGQVFSDAQGDTVYDGLYVCDGAIIPRSLGVNPLLTISALAERNCALLAGDRGWQIDYRLPSAPPAPAEPLPMGIEFTETMRGYVSTTVKDDYQRAADQGRRDNSPLEFTLSVIADDLDRLLSDPEHPARLIGTVTAPALSSKPLFVDDGTFNLFVADPDRVDTRLMRYRMTMLSEEGKTYFFDGMKLIHDGPAYDAWVDTTTLFIAVYDGDGPDSPVLGKGILTIAPNDFMRQMSTLRVTNATSVAERLEANARFGRYFAGVLYDAYGGVVAGPTAFDSDTPPRKKRQLRVGAPEVHSFQTVDGVPLRLTRYQGGSKGPVILSHGLGVSSLIFSIDTIETNLLEYLYAHGYDVWLLDYRASIALAASATPFTADDVATRDYPAAVDAVRALTGASSVQMVVHCFGSTTFFMAMLAGLSGVRSAVCSQIATHIKVLPVTQVKAGLHLSELLEALGVESLTAYADRHEDWRNLLYDRALALYPLDNAEGRCRNATCHRITFMYAPLYEHAQLNDATHDALHEMFGVANLRAFDHLGLMTRAGHLVAADGSEAYLPHLDRLKIPIAFIHGARNQCFVPESTEITYDLLREKNGSDLYTRHLIPDYGHIDCIFGKNAVVDVYPHVLNHLEGAGR